MTTTSRTLLITGTSSGIGRALTERLIKDGHRVIGFARNHEKFCPEESLYVPMTVDMIEPAEIRNGIERVLRDYPKIDGVISNAGAGTMGTLEQFSFAQIRDALDVNLLSHVYLARCVIPYFKREGRGDFIFIGSEASLSGSKKGTLYCAAKFGLRGFAQSLRQECSRNGVRVMAVYPGMVRTPFFDSLSFEPGPESDNALRPEDIAEVISTMLSLPKGSVIDEVELNPLKKVISPKR